MVATQSESPMADVGPIRATFTVLITSGVHCPLALASSMPHTMPLQMDPTCASVLKRVTWRFKAWAFSSLVSYSSSTTGAMDWPKAMPSILSACWEQPFQKNQFQND